MLKIWLLAVIAVIVASGNALAVTNCDSIYSPGNPFLCKGSNNIEGNCTWWAWHWLRYGKGDRKLLDSNSFRKSAYTWANKAVSLGYTVTTTPTKDAVAVNETVGGYGHVASVDQVTSTGVWVYEMNWEMTGLRRKFYNNGFFTRFIVPDPQPKLVKIEPDPIYKDFVDRPFTLTGENMDKVATLELTFPDNTSGTLSGGQIGWRNYSQLQFWATFGNHGRYVINAVSDRRVESIPQMPFTVYNP